MMLHMVFKVKRPTAINAFNLACAAQMRRIWWFKDFKKGKIRLHSDFSVIILKTQSYEGRTLMNLHDKLVNVKQNKEASA